MDILEELRELKAKYAALLALSATLQSQEHELRREVAVGSGLKLVLEDDDEIDLSAPGTAILDAGVNLMCASLLEGAVPALRVLDLEANGLSRAGGGSLASALAQHACPLLEHMDLSCNIIRSEACAELATALHACPQLRYLDLHGNAVADAGCVALADALAAGAAPALAHLDLSANRIEARGCHALARLCTSAPASAQQHGSSLMRLSLRENGIESCAPFFPKRGDGQGRQLSLKSLDLSWNCIADLTSCLGDVGVADDIGDVSARRDARSAPLPAGARLQPCDALEALFLHGNSLPDAECARLCAALKTSGVAPLMQGAGSPPGGDGRRALCGTRGKDGFPLRTKSRDRAGVPGRLRHCLRLLADGSTTNPQLCRLPLWRSEAALPTTAGVAAAERRSVAPTTVEDTPPAKLPPSRRLRRDGFVVQPPLSPLTDMARLDALVARIEAVGFPPLFAFMSNALWTFIVARVWPAVRALLGVECVLVPGSGFAWSLKATGETTYPRDGEFRRWQNAALEKAGVDDTATAAASAAAADDQRAAHHGVGSSFGLPHRDYSATDSIRTRGPADGASATARRRDAGDDDIDDPALLRSVLHSFVCEFFFCLLTSFVCSASGFR